MLLLLACVDASDSTRKGGPDFTLPDDTATPDDTGDTGDTPDSGDTADSGDSADTGAPGPTYTVCDSDDGVYATLQAAFDALGDGASITVCSGTFAGFATDDLIVVLVGTGETVIDGGDGAAVHVHHGGIQLTGVTLRGTSIDVEGGAIAAEHSTVLLQDVEITGNTTSTLISLDGSSLLSDSVWIHDNTFPVDDASPSRLIRLAEESSLDLGHARVEHNEAWTLIDADGGDLALQNALLTHNTVGSPGLFSAPASAVTLTNVVVSTNAAPATATLLGASSVTVSNSILHANTAATTLGLASVRYTLLHDSPGDLPLGDGVLSADPAFTDAPGGDFTLSAASPARDAGDPDAALNDPDGSRNDLGAYGGPDGAW